MADLKISELTNLTAADPANDMIPIVDVSATPPASGSTKRISINNILACSPTATLASASITGDLTVDTNTLYVNSSLNRVGIGTASPATILDIQSSGSVFARIQNTASSADAYLLVKNTLGEGFFGINATGPYIYTAGSLPITFTTAASERYRIASDGVATWSNVGGVAGTAMTLNANGLGVGTTPSYKLHVFGASPALTIQDSSSAAGGVGGTMNFISYTSGTSGANIEAQIKGVKSSASSAGELLFFTSDSSGNSQQRFMVDGTGNVGIGVQPSAWGSNWKANHVGTVGSFASSGAGSAPPTAMVIGAYNDNTNWKYQFSSTGAARYEMTGANAGSVHAWYTSPGGTVNTNITDFATPKMTLDASGNLILLSSNTPATLTTNGQLTVNATSNTNLRFSYRGSDGVTRVANITLA